MLKPRLLQRSSQGGRRRALTCSLREGQIPPSALPWGRRDREGTGRWGGGHQGDRQWRLHPFPLSQGTAAVSAKVETCKWQARFAAFPEQQQLSQNKHSQKHEALKPPPRHIHSHIYTHHNSCYIKAVITTASWLSISVYLWCITHFNAILKPRLSCHCSVFGWGKKEKKKKMAVMYSMLFPENKGQMNAQHLLGSSNSELFIAW